MGDRWPLARRDRGRVARPGQAPGRGASTVPGAVRGPADRALRSPACRSSSNKRCPRRGAAGRSAPSCSSDSSAAHSPSWPRTRSALGARRTPGARLRPARAPSSSPASERSSRRGARHPPRRRGTYRQGPVARLGSVRPGCRDQHRSDQVSLVPEDHLFWDAGAAPDSAASSAPDSDQLHTLRAHRPRRPGHHAARRWGISMIRSEDIPAIAATSACSDRLRGVRNPGK